MRPTGEAPLCRHCRPAIAELAQITSQGGSVHGLLAILAQLEMVPGPQDISATPALLMRLPFIAFRRRRRHVVRQIANTTDNCLATQTGHGRAFTTQEFGVVFQPCPHAGPSGGNTERSAIRHLTIWPPLVAAARPSTTEAQEADAAAPDKPHPVELVASLNARVPGAAVDEEALDEHAYVIDVALHRPNTNAVDR